MADNIEIIPGVELDDDIEVIPPDVDETYSIHEENDTIGGYEPSILRFPTEGIITFFKCLICQLLIRNPVTNTDNRDKPCRHMFCAECIDRNGVMRQPRSNVCPCCKIEWSNKQLGSIISHFYNSLEIFCPFKCDAELTIGDIEAHKLVCLGPDNPYCILCEMEKPRNTVHDCAKIQYEKRRQLALELAEDRERLQLMKDENARLKIENARLTSENSRLQSQRNLANTNRNQALVRRLRRESSFQRAIINARPYRRPNPPPYTFSVYYNNECYGLEREFDENDNWQTVRHRIERVTELPSNSFDIIDLTWFRRHDEERLGRSLHENHNLLLVNRDTARPAGTLTAEIMIQPPGQ